MNRLLESARAIVAYFDDKDDIDFTRMEANLKELRAAIAKEEARIVRPKRLCPDNFCNFELNHEGKHSFQLGYDTITTGLQDLKSAAEKRHREFDRRQINRREFVGNGAMPE